MKKRIIFSIFILLSAQNAIAFEYGGGFDEGELGLGQNAIVFDEKESDPVIPGDDSVKLYAKDDGSGNSELYMIDPAGVVTLFGSGGYSPGGTDVAVADGGTGASTLTGILLGNGTSAVTGITTSAGIFTAISDETGSGVLVGGTSPTFTTQITTPLIYGSSASNGDITIHGTSDATRTTSYVLLQPTAGNVGIGNSAPDATLHVTGTLHVTDDATFDGDLIFGGANASTFGDGTSATYPITFDLSGTDFTMTASSGAMTSTGDWTLPTLSGKIDRNNTAVNDDDCTGEQGLYWYDTTDSAFEFCDSNSGAPVTISGGSDTNAVKEYWWPCAATMPLQSADSIPSLAKDAGTNIDQLTCDYDSSVDEGRSVAFKVPSDVTSGNVTFRAYWYAASVTTGNVLWDFQHNSGVAEGVDPDAALTSELATADDVQGTAGLITVTTWTETIANLGWAANDLVYGVFLRDVSGDDLAADAKVIGFSVEIPRA